MAKTRVKYVCSNCNNESLKYMGRCPRCGEFNTYQEVVEEVQKASAARQNRAPVGGSRPQPQRLAEITGEQEERYFVPVEEFNRVLGGGLVPGSITLISGDPGIGKCVTGDTRILDPVTGAYLPITAWAEQNHAVLSLNDASYKLNSDNTLAFHNQGTRPVVKLTTRLGRTLKCTVNHPLLTQNGWQPVSELSVGSRVAAPRSLPYFGNQPLPENHVKLIGYIISDGSAGDQINITSMLDEVAQDAAEIAEAFQLQLKIYPKPGNRAKQYRFTAPRYKGEARQEFATALRNARIKAKISAAEWARRAGVNYALFSQWEAGNTVPDAIRLQLLADAINIPLADLAPEARITAERKTNIMYFAEAYGLRHAKAHNKFVPAPIFNLPREQLALFLKIVFSCDGSIYIMGGKNAGISYSTISLQLAQDLQHLLLRFGLVFKLRTKPMQVNGNPYTAYELQMLGIENARRFLNEIGIYGREEAKQQLANFDAPVGHSTHFDTIPTGQAFYEHLTKAAQTSNFAEITRQVGTKVKNRRHDRPLTRYLVERLATTYPDERLNALAFGDVYWDEIIEIENCGEEEVYDISVENHHNFVANDLIVHNSTMLLQTSAILAQSVGTVLYVSGEESARQIKMRADRLSLKADDLYLLTETNLGSIFEQVNRLNPKILIIDSIQTIHTDEIDSSPGLVSQVRECAIRLQGLAKSSAISVFLIGHVTKDGSIAGPRVLEHIVDTVLYLEGDPYHAFRLLRSVKNRFGATSEVGVFEMQGAGMVEVPNPSEAFLAERVINAPGSAIAVTMEGTRPLLVELQALTSPTTFGNPRRTPNGVDFNRMLLISAVLGKRVGLHLAEQDIFVNVIGGLKVSEPASDLAMAIAIASSYYDKTVPADLAIVGEVGLSGELRAVSQLAARLNEAAKIGFKKALVPKTRRGIDSVPKGIELIQVRNIVEALNFAVPK